MEDEAYWGRLTCLWRTCLLFQTNWAWRCLMGNPFAQHRPLNATRWFRLRLHTNRNKNWLCGAALLRFEPSRVYGSRGRNCRSGVIKCTRRRVALNGLPIMLNLSAISDGRLCEISVTDSVTPGMPHGTDVKIYVGSNWY